MNKEKADGQLKQLEGSVKEALGKVVGDDSLAAKGAAEKVAGQVLEASSKNKAAAKTVKKKPTT